MRFLIIIIISLALSQQVISQKKFDTLSVFYPTPTFDTANDEPNHYYYQGNKRVDQKTGEAGRIAGQLISKCKPCVLKVYGTNGIFSEGLQYGDGRIGYWIEYYPQSGKKKLTGQFEEFPSKDCFKCGKESGKWKYFNLKGKLIKVETYSNGKLVNSQKVF